MIEQKLQLLDVQDKQIMLSIKVNDTLLNLLNDYHDISPAEAVVFFNDLSKKMIEHEGNVVNRRKKAICNRGRNTWITVDNSEADKYDDLYEAYAFRGFYPGTKLPFKLSAVLNKHMCCCAVSIGNKNHGTSFSENTIKHLEQVVADSILLDKKPEEISSDVPKLKTFRCMRPKGMDLLKKGK